MAVSLGAYVTIADREREIEALIADLQDATSNSSQKELFRVVSGLQTVLFPRNVTVSVQLEEDGRKKRSTADASYWNFNTGEAVLLFEPVDGKASAQPKGPQQVVSETPSIEIPGEPPTAAEPNDTSLSQCVEALANAEKLGKRFIAYKWFRDLVLPGLPHAWTKDPELRQQVLNAAVEAGRIAVQKIPNPRQPMFPTTTLSVNRSAAGGGVKPRFSPVPISGAPLSATILKDRG